jgi:hypothetical protein
LVLVARTVVPLNFDQVAGCIVAVASRSFTRVTLGGDLHQASVTIKFIIPGDRVIAGFGRLQLIRRVVLVC